MPQDLQWFKLTQFIISLKYKASHLASDGTFNTLREITFDWVGKGKEISAQWWNASMALALCTSIDARC